MYNRYIPHSGGYERVVMEDGQPQGAGGEHHQDRRPPPAGGPAGGGHGAWLTGLLKSLGLENLDRGDTLLMLILLLLLTDGDDLEPVITLGLLLLFGLGGRERGEKG